MAKSATIKIGDRTVMVRELLLQEVHELMNAPPRPVIEGIAHLLTLCSDITGDDLMGYAPSELQPMIDTMLELNASFFAQAETLQQPEISAEMRKKILRISMLAYLLSSPPDTE